MTITVGGSNITFNDSTTQSTAFGGNAIFGQAFTSSGTFTIPSGVTALKVTVVGGGGNGGGVSGSAPAGGGGGSAGSTAIKYFTGLTSGNTLAVTVGGVGGTSSVASGTQTITTVSAGGSGGAVSGSTISIVGNSTTCGWGLQPACACIGVGGSGGSTQFGYGGTGAITGGYQSGTNGNPSKGYGSGGGGGAKGAGQFVSANGGAGAGGIVIFEW